MIPTKPNTIMKAYSLIEILVALVIVSGLILGSVFLIQTYLFSLRWDRLFSALESVFLETHVAGLSMLASGSEIPESYHLYFETGQSASFWYLETKNDEGKRAITYQDPKNDEELGIDPLVLDAIIMEEEVQGALQMRTLSAVLFTFSPPFSDLAFEEFSTPLSKNSFQISSPFLRGTQSAACQEKPSVCQIILRYVRPGTSEQKSFSVSPLKRFERHYF